MHEHVYACVCVCVENRGETLGIPAAPPTPFPDGECPTGKPQSLRKHDCFTVRSAFCQHRDMLNPSYRECDS